MLDSELALVGGESQDDVVGDELLQAWDDGPVNGLAVASPAPSGGDAREGASQRGWGDRW